MTARMAYKRPVARAARARPSGVGKRQDGGKAAKGAGELTESRPGRGRNWVYRQVTVG